MSSFTVTTVVNTDVYHAWEFCFNQINGWWPKSHFTSEKTERFIIETFLGGRAYEDCGEGTGLVWGDVIGVDYPKSLQIRGNLTKEFGGPAISYERYSFVPREASTEVIYSVDFIGQINPKSFTLLKEGWTDLLQVRFKKYCAERV